MPRHGNDDDDDGDDDEGRLDPSRRAVRNIGGDNGGRLDHHAVPLLTLMV